MLQTVQIFAAQGLKSSWLLSANLPICTAARKRSTVDEESPHQPIAIVAARFVRRC